VAGIANHFTGPFEIISIDGRHHLHHAARYLPRFLGIILKVTLDVAIVAPTPSAEMTKRIGGMLRSTLVLRRFAQKPSSMVTARTGTLCSLA
jgi:hypothetical protein